MFKVDLIDGDAYLWKKQDGEAIVERDNGYFPRFYVDSDREKLKNLRPWLSGMNEVHATCFERWQPTLSKERAEVLRIDVRREDHVSKIASRIKKNRKRSDFRFYNVGLSRQFRYCIQNQIRPVPEEELVRMELSLEKRFLADDDLSKLKLNGESFGDELEALKAVKQELTLRDPDILLVDRGQLLELLRKKKEDYNLGFSLGRIDSFQRLAGGNTVSSYGKTQHSSARYNVPGRIVIDRSNSFLLGEATLEGLWDLVERSWKPLQELSWGSIGRVLTSIEVRKAYLEDGILTPWKNWRGESFKTADTLHRADRGGFIFNPEPGIEEDVYEVDFASLFPNIMVKKNISPETVNCNCCDNSEVPELDYSICQKNRGFISETLKPLVEDRQEMKEELKRGIEDEKERKIKQGSVDAIKWLLVSCFGYMGHEHASYGAIECHQAIQAYDRQIMLEAKHILERNGYKIVHGIIDSLWVKPGEEATGIEQVCEEVTEEIGIELELEHSFDWVAFVPRSSTNVTVSTLNRYFGKKKEGGFKTAGIELEQSSSSEFIKQSQEDMLEAFAESRNPEQVLEVVKEKKERLDSGDVDPEKLVVEKKTSKSLEDYSVENRTVAALKRSEELGIDLKPGQKVEYVVRNDDSVSSLQRVRLPFEEVDRYDQEFYFTQLVRAAESVLSPLGVDRDEIRSACRESGQKKLVHSLG